MRDAMIPSADDFRTELARTFERAVAEGQTHVEVVSGDLHWRVGRYPPERFTEHAMPVCCAMMREAMNPAFGDRMLSSHFSGVGALVRIRFVLPRPVATAGCMSAPQRIRAGA